MQPAYYHVPLLVAPDGRRLSKRERDLDMEHLRRRYTPEQLTGRLAFLAGLRQKDAAVTPGELTREFTWDVIHKKDIPISEDF